MIKLFFLTTILVLLFSGDAISQVYQTNENNLSPMAFLNMMKINDGQIKNVGGITMRGHFPTGWVTKKDIDSLIALVNSKTKCNCYLNPLSSIIPWKDSADLGGYAIVLIRSYQQKKKVDFGLYACPKTTKEEAEKMMTWWFKIQSGNSKISTLL